MNDQRNTTTASKDADLELAPLLARRELWLLVSAGLADPFHRQRIDLLRDRSFRTRAVRSAALLAAENSSISLGPGELLMDSRRPQVLFESLDSESATNAYQTIFGLTSVSQQCPPCATEFESNTDLSYRSHRLADIAGFYRAFGFSLVQHTKERADHIAVEAEFMYLLLAKEAAARQVGKEDAAAVCLTARREFFREHVGWWLPAFSRLLKKVSPPGYYRHLAELAAALSAIERTSLELSPFQGKFVPSPSGQVPEAACFTCAGARET